MHPRSLYIACFEADMSGTERLSFPHLLNIPLWNGTLHTLLSEYLSVVLLLCEVDSRWPHSKSFLPC